MKHVSSMFAERVARFVRRSGLPLATMLACSAWVHGCARETQDDADTRDSGSGDDRPMSDGHTHSHAGRSAADAGAVQDAGDAGSAASELYDWDLPAGFPIPKVPSANPVTREKVELGRRLFYDVRLSGNGTQSCGSCHQQERAFTDGRRVGIGSTGEAHVRSSMSLVNVAYASSFTWANATLGSLEDQALVPLFGETPIELGLTGNAQAAIAVLRADERARALFELAFPDEPEPIAVSTIVAAIATFERVLVSGRSAYDRHVQLGDESALSAAQKRGMNLFFSETLECFHCHGGFNFSGAVTHEGKVFDENTFHNNGLYNLDGRGAYPDDDQGLYAFTGDPADMGRFKAPTLRNIAVTAPYMHDGSIATLEEVLDHYAAGGRVITEGRYAGDGRASPFKSEMIAGFALSAADKADVIAFLNSLTDDELLRDPRYADPELESTAAEK